MKIKAIVWQEEKVWCGSVPALPCCHTWGERYDELLEMLDEAVRAWLEVASEIEKIEPPKREIQLSRMERFSTNECNSREMFSKLSVSLDCP